MSQEHQSSAATYSYLGPSGTFTESALAQVEAAAGQPWRPVNNVGEALDDVVTGRSVAAMIAIENSIDGGVSVAQDALATIPDLRIVGEYLVPVGFTLVARYGTVLADVRTIAAHPVAYAQCNSWLNAQLPSHGHIPASSNVQAAALLLETDADGTPASTADAAIAPAGFLGASGDRHDLVALADGIIDNPNAVTRFALVSRDRRVPPRTGADKTSIIAELPDDQAGSLLGLLEQFSTRGINLSLIESRPIGDALGRYRFVIDADGHILEERMADALLGLRRFCPKVLFLGSYPRADHVAVDYHTRYSDDVFVEARDWLRALLTEAPTES